MDLIKKGRELTQTIKNVSRLKEIIAVLAKNGFDEFIIKTGIHTKIPNFVVPKSRLSQAIESEPKESWPQIVGYRLRKSFEELGPSFIKVGQLLATREDLFDVGFINEMKILQDKVQGIPFTEAQKMIDESLGQPSSEIFTSINEEAIGTASIGVVYKGELKDGSAVVLKVQRPGVGATIRTDFALLDMIITRVEKVSAEIKSLGLSRLVRDFGMHLEIELDYRVEALNCERLKSVMHRLDGADTFYIPKIYKDHSSERLLVMEYLDGIPFSDAERVNQVRDKIHAAMEKGLRVFIHSLLKEGFFHADLHGGNFFLINDQQIGLVDFGSVGTLAKSSRMSLIAMLYALVNFNFENLVYEFLDVAEYEKIPDVDELIRDVKTALMPFVGLTVQQVNVSVLLRHIMSTLSKHGLYLPREWFIVFRAFITLDGVGKSLDMDFDIFALMENDLKDIIQEMMSKEQLMEDGLWLGRDVLNSVKGLPRHLRWFLKEFAKRDYAVKIIQTGHEKELRLLAKSLQFLGLSVFASLFMFAGTWLLQGLDLEGPRSIPWITWILWCASFGMLNLAFFRVRSKKK